MCEQISVNTLKLQSHVSLKVFVSLNDENKNCDVKVAQMVRGGAQSGLEWNYFPEIWNTRIN